MLAVGRKLVRIDREMRGGAWPREMLTQCLGKTLGVFGTGTIGARVITLAKALGMEVLAWSARGDEGHVRSLGARPAAKDDILRAATNAPVLVPLREKRRKRRRQWRRLR